MDLSQYADRIRRGATPDFPTSADSLAFARQLDAQDELRHLREQFVLPTRSSLRKQKLDGKLPATTPTPQHPLGSRSADGDDVSDDGCVPALYFVGNSLGLQPKAVRSYVDAQLETWASIGVSGHFRTLENSPLTAWQDLAEDCALKSADIVGASTHEVVIMNTLTVNLHVMMASFYRPDSRRHKVILEWKPFPSDHYAIESHIVWHGLDPRASMVKIEPDDGALISTKEVLRVIEEHADDTALLLLPGVQYYSGQFFDMARITSFARQRGIVVGWDLAHAVGNVELRLHDWDVDFACWCTYKYLNAGPGAIAGTFVHERHGGVAWNEHGPDAQPSYRPRLTGWYGGDKSVRFNMAQTFVPTPGASGYQASNPSAIDLASLSAALSVFAKTSMRAVRSKSLALTAYAEHLFYRMLDDDPQSGETTPLFRIITPSDPLQRGAQLSLLLRDGLLDRVAQVLEDNGAVCDKRKPDVIRVAPAPLYTSFEDVWKFAQVLRLAFGLPPSPVHSSTSKES